MSDFWEVVSDDCAVVVLESPLALPALLVVGEESVPVVTVPAESISSIAAKGSTSAAGAGAGDASIVVVIPTTGTSCNMDRLDMDVDRLLISISSSMKSDCSFGEHRSFVSRCEKEGNGDTMVHASDKTAIFKGRSNRKKKRISFRVISIRIIVKLVSSKVQVQCMKQTQRVAQVS